MQTDNLYREYLIRLEVVRESSKPLQVCSPKEILDIIRERLGKTDREFLIAVFLSNANTVNSIQEVSIGTLDRALFSAREILKAAVISNSQSIIMLHSHPSGSIIPSREDIRATHVVKAAARLFSITLLDHLVVGSDGKYYSFKESGKL